jgi:hypothetical protein
MSQPREHEESTLPDRAAEHFQRFGLRPTSDALPEIRTALERETARGMDHQDTEFLNVCCLQLFAAGRLEDVLLIWQAKESSWNAHGAIDVAFLCGAGLLQTKAYLEQQECEAANKAFQYIEKCERCGNLRVSIQCNTPITINPISSPKQTDALVGLRFRRNPP